MEGGCCSKHQPSQPDGVCFEGQALGDLGGEEGSDKEGDTKRMSRHLFASSQGDYNTPPQALAPLVLIHGAVTWWQPSWGIQKGADQVCLPIETKQFKGLQQ